MPDSNSNMEAKLKKLGDHVRLGWAKKHPASDKYTESVRDIVREKWEQEHRAEKARKPAPDAGKSRERKRDEPER